jgi:deoxyribodipyrimidine photo-lyase
MGWQWSAGCGCDAQPYFRVFNPTAQGERFDRAVATFAAGSRSSPVFPRSTSIASWEAPPGVLDAAGVVLGETYAKPRVDHGAARERFLRAAEEHVTRGGEE